MSDKNFTIYVTGGTNVFIPVLSDDQRMYLFPFYRMTRSR